MKVITTSAFLCALLLSGCDAAETETVSAADKNNDPELTAFIDNIKSELIFVEGGKFKMGDFGVEYYEEHLPLEADKDSKPLHDVELTSYSISKYKTRNEDFQFYLKHEGLPLRELQGRSRKPEWDTLNKDKNRPAHGDWYEANNYCTWLAKVTHLPFSLPTEAQWEYAARSRGQYLVVATDDGTWKVKDGKGINIATDRERAELARKNRSELSTYYTMPVDRYPPNPLGVYDMTGNGFEWIKDWYSPDYYQHSPEKDPQGPTKNEAIDSEGQYLKVLRGNRSAEPEQGTSISRASSPPEIHGYRLMTTTIRCVVNSPSPVK